MRKLTPRQTVLLVAVFFGAPVLSILRAAFTPASQWERLQVEIGGKVEPDDDLLPTAEFPAAAGQTYSILLQKDLKDPHRMRLWAKLPQPVIDSPEGVLRQIACRFGREVARRPAYAGITQFVLFREGLTDDAPLQDLEVALARC